MKRSWLLLNSDPAAGGGGTALAELKTLLTDGVKQIGENTKTLTGLDHRVKGVETEIKTAGDSIATLRSDVDAMKKSRLEPQLRQVRPKGKVTDHAARELASLFILHCERSNKLEALASGASAAQKMALEARTVLGIPHTKTALTTSDIPLPTSFTGELRELVAEFGVVRNQMFPYPLGQGTTRPPRMGTRPAFGSIVMSAAVDEKSPTITFASLESHKLGGLVKVPREIDDQSIVQMGQYLARYGAVEFARAEDTWGFLADGTATYESITGVCKTAADNSKLVTLAAGKTAPSDAVLADFRALRPYVNVTARKGGKYYLNHTWETRLRDFNTQANPNAFMYRPDGTATLDGFEIVWVEVLSEYSTAAAVSTYLAVFGDLQWWWFGERGSPRVDFSEHVFFENDQLATRFLEEIDFDYQALACAAVLKTPAA